MYCGTTREVNDSNSYNSKLTIDNFPFKFPQNTCKSDLCINL